MRASTNDWTKVLLSWHGHDRGGVHVPFQNINPLGSAPIITGLIHRLRKLAVDIAAGEIDTPRWLFLIGGPGNGKSETVQDFLATLDRELQMEGELVNHLVRAFSPQPLIPRRIEVIPSEIHDSGEFEVKIKRLIIVQDATATNEALGNSAKQLVDDILDLLTSAELPIPLFIACANRGLLARALKEARLSQAGEEVTSIIEELIKASSLGVETLTNDRDRPSCWPLNLWPKVACWPLDLESLLVSSNGTPSPIEQIVSFAVEASNWEPYCKDCYSRDVCPFVQNAIWLRDDTTRNNLLRILRRGELLLGQRWNFRDAYSLLAEIIVGQWTDFGSHGHPCLWVHDQADKLKSNLGFDDAIQASLTLFQRLYPHAMFPANGGYNMDQEFAQVLNERNITSSIIEAWDKIEIGSIKSIRNRLLKDFISLDPSLYTPRTHNHVLRLIENDYSQSVQQGNSRVSDFTLSGSS